MRGRHENGFTLVEMVIVLGVAGIILGIAWGMIHPWIETSRRITTEQKLEIIADHLSSYVKVNNRLPCPSDPDMTPGSGQPPFGFQRGSGTSGTNNMTHCSGNNTEGIVPFRTIGLIEDQIRDGWGRFITYRISPAFAMNPSSGNYDNIHALCRFRSWIEWHGENTFVNRNPDKARFCCPPSSGTGNPNNDIVILDDIPGSGDPMWAGTRTNQGSMYDDLNTQADIDDVDTIETPEAAQVETLAFVLVSHGKNGYGAFTGRNSNERMADAENIAGATEDENQDGDNIFVAENYIGQAGSFYDDILLWRTQGQIYSEFGDDSCLKP